MDRPKHPKNTKNDKDACCPKCQLPGMLGPVTHQADYVMLDDGTEILVWKCRRCSFVWETLAYQPEEEG